MLDVTARDYGARLATWETDQGELQLPAVAHVHTDRHPAPEFASLVLARQRHPTLPTLQVRGTVFTPGEDDEGLPKGLIYPAAAGASLQEAADDLSAPKRGFQIANRPQALGPHNGLSVVVGGRFVAGDPWRLPGYLVEARSRAGPNAVLFLPGLGRPDQVALAAYCGVDLFDGLAAVLAAKRGELFTPEGSLPVNEVEEELGGSPAAFEAAQEGWNAQRLRRHNEWVLEAEVRRVRQAVRDGSLRELVEARAHTSPQHLSVLRRLDREHADFFEPRVPSLRERAMPIVSRESLARPEIERWVQRLGTRYTPPSQAQVLVVLPCSATKPYENSPTHQRIRPVINRHGKGRAHVATLTSPIGAVPEELEFAYPAQHYDIPVTGEWFEEEADVVRRGFEALAATQAYDHVLLHLPPEEVELVEEVFPKAEVTTASGAHVTDRSSLDRLKETLVEVARPYQAIARTDLFREHMRSRLDWQFGPGVGEALLEETTIRGKYPFLRIMDPDDDQVALFQPRRGALTLATEGGRRLAAATEDHRVHIDDFTPKGTVFAPGVKDASPGIRVEDEVVCVFEDEFRAVGRAVAPGPEMAAMEGGACVEVRHHA